MSRPRAAGIEIAERDAGPVLEALLEIGATASLPVSGTSMEPALRAGDLAVIAPFLGLPRPGQIVLARVSGRLVAHRLVGVALRDGRRIYRLQGDAEPGMDGAITREDLLGRVVALVRQGQRLEVDDGPLARRRGLLRCALSRRRARLLRGLVVALLGGLGVLGPASVADQDATLAPAPEYRFGAGDVLSLRIWDGEKIDELRLTVQSDGEAFLPIKGIGSLQVAGRTVAEVKRDIEQRLGGIYKETNVELLITKFAGQKVSLMGEVRTTSRTDSGPGEWALQGPTHLVAFLSVHGGPSQDADLMRLQLIRRNAQRRELNLYRAVFQGAEEDDPLLEAGDLVFIPSMSMGNRKVFVLGEVNAPGVVPIVDKIGLVEAITRAGGFTRGGYMKGVVVVKRGPDGQATLQIANFKQMFREGKMEADVPLQPGDIVFVPRRAIVTLQEVFSIINPALASIESVYIINNFRKN